MPHGKQAKLLTPKQETAVLTYLQTRRYPVRDRVMFLLSLKAGSLNLSPFVEDQSDQNT
jgi:integrase/recombinase XerD